MAKATWYLEKFRKGDELRPPNERGTCVSNDGEEIVLLFDDGTDFELAGEWPLKEGDRVVMYHEQ
jgi:hypothetical protein